MPMTQYGAVALQLWDAARDARLRDRIDAIIVREYPRSPDWGLDQAPDRADRDKKGRPRFGKRTRHTHGMLYGRQARARAKEAIDVWLYDDAWRYAPRRLHVPVPATREPDSGAQPRLRVRRTAMYPGPAYDVMSGATGLRGRVEHPVAATRLPVRWPRVIVPDPDGTPRPLAVAHGDHHGEFLLLLPPSRFLNVTGPAGRVDVDIEIRWQTLPPYAADSDPLNDLPLENVGAAAGVADPDMTPLAESPDPVAMGWTLPASYGASLPRTITFTAGIIHRDVFVV
jgi:hypothetical protein